MAERVDRYLMISFCCALMNRGPTFRKAYTSLLPLLEVGHELIIVDHGSADIDLQSMRARVVHRPLPFRRAAALNEAARMAMHETLFFHDADVVVPAKFDQTILEIVRPGTAFFPICFYLARRRPMVAEPKNGRWATTGFGLCGLHRDDFFHLNGWDERFVRYGREDVDFFHRTSQQLTVVRENCLGLFHCWHPQNGHYKNKYYLASSQAIATELG